MRLALKKNQKYQVSEKKVRRLMEIMGLKAVSSGLSVSSRAMEHKVYPLSSLERSEDHQA